MHAYIYIYIHSIYIYLHSASHFISCSEGDCRFLIRYEDKLKLINILIYLFNVLFRRGGRSDDDSQCFSFGGYLKQFQKRHSLGPQVFSGQRLNSGELHHLTVLEAVRLSFLFWAAATENQRRVQDAGPTVNVNGVALHQGQGHLIWPRMGHGTELAEFCYPLLITKSN